MVGGSILFKFSGSKTQSALVSKKTFVQVQQAKTIESTALLSFKANLEAIEEGIVGSKISGQVIRLFFEDGDRVSQGATLVALDDQDLNNQLQVAEINMQKMETTLESSQRSYDRIKALFESGAKSKSDYEDAETALKTARANLEAEKVTIQGINNSLANCVIKAPISGKVEEKNVSLGQYVSPGTQLAKVKNTSSLKAVIQLKQSDMDKVQVGQQATLKMSKTDKEGYTGVVKNIAGSADSSTRVFDCQIQIDNAQGKLRPGTFGYVELDSGQKSQMVTIPLAALVGSNGSYSVFTVEEGVARKRSVSVGEIQSDVVQIVSGLKAGENVIITNLNSLQDGDAVEFEGQEAK